MTEILFPDSAAAVCTPRESIDRAALHTLSEVTSKWGLTMSMHEMKLFVMGAPYADEDLLPITI